MNQCLGENGILNVRIQELHSLVEKYLDSGKGIPVDGNVIPDNHMVEMDDVVILHDSLFQKITEGIFKKENLTVKKVFMMLLSMLWQ